MITPLQRVATSKKNIVKFTDKDYLTIRALRNKHLELLFCQKNLQMMHEKYDRVVSCALKMFVEYEQLLEKDKQNV